MSSGSIMPAYQWLVRDKHDRSDVQDKMRAMVTLGVPYSEEDISNAQTAMEEQAKQIEESLYSDPDFAKTYEEDKSRALASGQEFVEMKDREIIALIAYLQRLGTDIKVKDTDQLLSENK
jgi:cytochrome c oxidase cbb3-type subunit I/II